MKIFTAMALSGLLAGCATTPFTILPSTQYAWETAKGLCALGEETACKQLPYFPLLVKKEQHW